MTDRNPRPASRPVDSVNPQKSRHGLQRVWHATLISVAGFRAGWREAAFRQEVVCAAVMVPAAFWVGRTWVEVAVLAAVVDAAVVATGIARPEIGPTRIVAAQVTGP